MAMPYGACFGRDRQLLVPSSERGCMRCGEQHGSAVVIMQQRIHAGATQHHELIYATSPLFNAEHVALHTSNTSTLTSATAAQPHRSSMQDMNHTGMDPPVVLHEQQHSIIK